MEHLYEKLKVLITHEVSVYEELVVLSQREKDAIIKNGVQEIDAIVAEKQLLLKKLKQLESERKELFCSFSEQTGVKDPSYHAIIKTAKGASREKLLRSAEKLEDTAAQLKQINWLNKTLIDTQMRYSAFFMGLVTGGADNTGTYSNSGRMSDKNANYSLLDQTI